MDKVLMSKYLNESNILCIVLVQTYEQQYLLLPKIEVLGYVYKTNPVVDLLLAGGDQLPRVISLGD